MWGERIFLTKQHNTHLALVSIAIFGEEAGVNELFAPALGLICGRCLQQSIDTFLFLGGNLLFYNFSQAAGEGRVRKVSWWHIHSGTNTHAQAQASYTHTRITHAFAVIFPLPFVVFLSKSAQALSNLEQASNCDKYSVSDT